jgi:branched-chain amino acid transport system substrate-binding protein
VECYERLKTQGTTGAAAFHPLSTPLTYALTERVAQDQIPLITVGIGRSDAADGRVFPYIFPVPSTWWSQNTAKIRFLGQRSGGMAQLKGLKIVHVYHDSDYGRETLPLLDTQAVRYGFAVQHLAVPEPGLDQKAAWLRVKVAQPDWVILRSLGAMTRTALKEAAQVGVPREKIVGSMGSCAEQEMVAAGEAAMGFICATWHGTGTHFPLIQESSPTSMRRARDLVRKVMSARCFGCGACCRACSRRRRCARPCATLATSPSPVRRCSGGSNTSPSRPRRSRNWGQRV